MLSNYKGACMLKLIWRTIIGGLMIGLLAFFFIFSCTSINKKIETPLHRIENSKQYVYNNNNFVLFERHILLDKFDNLCRESDECEKNEDSSYVKDSSSSGGVIKFIKNRAYTLTAAHFCADVNEANNEIEILEDQWDFVIVAKFMGVSYNGRIESIDVDSDICLISFLSHPYGSAYTDRIKIAKSDPAVGDPVYTISSPLSIHTSDLRIHFEGQFAGYDDDMGSVYTIPATFGSSGSLVLNEKGELISVISIAVIPFPEISAGPGTKQIRNFLKEYREDSGIILY
tara:strand:+ start:20 stop:877 length:858 start_codon:yes stop_codon:yes gene_type:complete